MSQEHKFSSVEQVKMEENRLLDENNKENVINHKKSEIIQKKRPILWNITSTLRSDNIQQNIPSTELTPKDLRFRIDQRKVYKIDKEVENLSDKIESIERVINNLKLEQKVYKKKKHDLQHNRQMTSGRASFAHRLSENCDEQIEMKRKVEQDSSQEVPIKKHKLLLANDSD